MSMSKGRLKSILKSFVERVSPMVSIIMPNITVWVVPLTHSKVMGTKNVNRATPIINGDAYVANQLLTLCNIPVISAARVQIKWEYNKGKASKFRRVVELYHPGGSFEVRFF